MRNIIKKLTWLAVPAVVMLAGCRAANHDYAQLTAELEEYVADQPADIGVAVIIDGKDTVEVNGRNDFPMMSVYKLPIALAVAEKCRAGGIELSDSCMVTSDALHRDTYSPMMQRYGDVDTVTITLRELLAYTLQQSDNNASDILLEWVDGAAEVDGYMEWLGIDGMNIQWSEDEMHHDIQRCYDNSATPVAMAELLNMVDQQNDCKHIREIKHMMETCATGVDRLAKPLADTGAIIGHKTGTGDRLPDGRLMAVNDAGYVHLPNGRRYAIAVFVAGSAYDIEQTSAIIADISDMVFNALNDEK